MGDKNNFEHIMPPTCQGEFAKNLIEQCEKQYKKAMEKAETPGLYSNSERAGHNSR